MNARREYRQYSVNISPSALIPHVENFDFFLDNRAPVLEGALRVYVNSGQSFMEPYLAYDQDGDNISVFELKVTYI